MVAEMGFFDLLVETLVDTVDDSRRERRAIGFTSY
jgi:hypothetical protein